MEFGQVHKCMEEVPKGWGTPEPWKRVKLGDIAEIKEIKVRRK
jgi:restriction endonuclease S subunit